MAAHGRPTERACRDFEVDLVLYHYGDCTETERLRVEAHVESCPGCRRYLRELKKLLPLTVRLDEPPEGFWLDYTRELRGKLSAAEKRVLWRNWRKTFYGIHRIWSVPALATALVLIVALALTLSKRDWRPAAIPPEDEAFLEALPMAENLEFFKTMELLDALDFLEASGGLANGSA